MAIKIPENIIIKSSKFLESDAENLFGDEDVFFAEANTMQHLMKELGVFKSVSEAQRAGRKGDIPTGFTDNFKASKKRRIWIWNPSE